MKKHIPGLISFAVLGLFVASNASGGFMVPLPDQAKGKARTENVPVLEKIVFIHYKKGYAKPPWAGGGDKGGDSKCYDFLSKGLKWRETPVDYVIDPDNNDSLTEGFVTSAMSAGAEEWDTHTGTSLFGTYAVDYNSSWDNSSPDGRNELLFGNYPQEGVIAVTVTWGYFSGPPQTRKIIEFDILFDTDFAWGDATADENVMDLQNIATHELGHGIGLGDVYETTCSAVTMYGYSTEGDIEKRTLEPADITGLQELYGE